jgi:hypothetical protein
LLWLVFLRIELEPAQLVVVLPLLGVFIGLEVVALQLGHPPNLVGLVLMPR